jgi:GcrA cell cycle regulator
MTWTTERKAELRQLWLVEGLSASVVAARNGWRGQPKLWDRAGVPNGLSKGVKAAVQRTLVKRMRKAVSATAKPVLVACVAEASPTQVPPRMRGPEPLVDPIETLPDTVLVGTMELMSTTCRWPLGDPRAEGFDFCGRYCEPAASYCAHHRALAYTKVGAPNAGPVERAHVAGGSRIMGLEAA